jgi:molecular chaperone DnaK
VIQWIVDEFRKESGIDLRNDRMALQRLKEAAEKAKIELSTVMQSEINLPFITADASGPKHLTMTLSRSKLEQLVGDLVENSLNPVRRALEDAKASPSDINEVVLVGGQTRMPMMQQTVEKFFGKEPHRGINPDEVVAIGAAIQAGVLGGEVKDILLLDVTPLTLGIETMGGVATPLIERNTTIPTKKSQIFSTASDMQTQVEVHVLQGERPMAADNKTLGRFILDGLPPAPRGVPQIEVTFDIDANGIVNVTAKDKATSREQKITITASSGLSKDEVDKMVKEAQRFADEDQKRKHEIEVRNNADTSSYQAEKMLRDLGDKVPAEVRTEVEGKIAAVRTAMQGKDVQDIEHKTQELAQSLQKIGEQMYQQQGGGPGGATPPPGGGTDGGPQGGAPGGQQGPGGSDTVEGEFREVK